jgi:TolB-like protein/DNA-binding winged helix-turn-helix (wHTH) protein/Flp pilus assembly protein TadD
MTGSPPNTMEKTSFNDFAIDVDKSVLLKAGKKVPLGPRPFEVLLYLFENRGRVVGKQELFEKIWGTDFVTDAALTQVVKEIRCALEDDAKSPRYIRTVHRKGYQFIAPLRDGPRVAKRGLRTLQFALVISAVGILILAISFWLRPTEPQYPPNSIAVLPFVNMSSDPEQEYFSDGISEELLNLLSKIPELRVISRSSSFALKGEKVDIPTMAKKLNVAHVLEGSVRKTGNQVRISAQLIETRTDTHLWSATYDRELENIFDVQDEISEAIVGALKGSLNIQLETSPQTIRTTNTEAHDAYLRGRYLVVQRTATTVEAAVREFEKAITLDPDYARAHAELAMAYLLLSSYGDLTTAEAIAKSMPHIDRAMVLDSNLAEAYAATGLLLSAQGNPEDAFTYQLQATRINPNYSIAHTWKGMTLEATGRYEEAFLSDEATLRLDPLSMKAVEAYTRSLIIRNRLDEAEQELEKMALIYPAYYTRLRGELAAVGGNWANQVLGYLDTMRIKPGYSYGLDLAFALIELDQEALSTAEPTSDRASTLRMLGRTDEVVEVVEEQLAENTTPRDRLLFSQLLGSAGDYNRARPMLEEAWQRYGRQVTRRLFEITHAAALIAIRRDAGDETGVDEILAAIKDNVRRYHAAGYTNGTWYVSADFEEGVAAYLAGEREQGIALIAKAADGGFFILPNEAYLQTLYDHPGFAPIIAGQEARQARERNRFLSIVCINNPYADVWQPAEGTCGRFAAKHKN